MKGEARLLTPDAERLAVAIVTALRADEVGVVIEMSIDTDVELQAQAAGVLALMVNQLLPEGEEGDAWLAEWGMDVAGR